MTVRRMKTYTGGQGYVYQYYFVGQRPALTGDADQAATEYIFDVTSDRKNTYSVSVFLPLQSVKQWAAKHGRNLTDAEQYGAVKMRLFQAFDEIENLMSDGRRLLVTDEVLEAVLAILGVA
jgi:hemoglobin-like flavoprotein